MERNLKIIQEFYLKNTRYGEVLALEKIAEVLQMSKSDLDKFWKEMYSSPLGKFKYIFTTLPYWGTKYKEVIINGQSFTHLIIIQDIFS